MLLSSSNTVSQNAYNWISNASYFLIFTTQLCIESRINSLIPHFITPISEPEPAREHHPNSCASSMHLWYLLKPSSQGASCSRKRIPCRQIRGSTPIQTTTYQAQTVARSQYSSCNVLGNGLTMSIPRMTIEIFRMVKAVCEVDENSLPFFLLCHSHISGGSASTRVSQCTYHFP